MNASQLWETTMNPDNRTLIQVTIDEAKKAEEVIVTLMGNDVLKRKKWINENVDFTNTDEFNITKGA